MVNFCSDYIRRLIFSMQVLNVYIGTGYNLQNSIKVDIEIIIIIFNIYLLKYEYFDDCF